MSLAGGMAINREEGMTEGPGRVRSEMGFGMGMGRREGAAALLQGTFLVDSRPPPLHNGNRKRIGGLGR